LTIYRLTSSIKNAHYY